MHNKFEEFYFRSQSNYTFLESIGQGAMGIVYLAQRNSGGIKDYVALKVLKKMDEFNRNALNKEANIAVQLRHENIVKTYGLESIPLSIMPDTFTKKLRDSNYSTQRIKKQKIRRLKFKKHKTKKTTYLDNNNLDSEDQLYLLVMDYIDGINLSSFTKQHLSNSLLMPLELGIFIISRIARALAYAHDYIVHRDVSPENILINTQGSCKLSDFGIAITNSEKPAFEAGKLPYMAPEQIYGKDVDERVDVFALGSITYQMLTGIPLLHVDKKLSLEEKIESLKKQFSKGFLAPAKICNDIPKLLSDIIMKMISVNVSKRYQRCNAIISDLEKKFLYAKGFGPTNNSLANYIALFESNFSFYNEEQIESLAFLRDKNGKLQLKRSLTPEIYTQKGLKLLEQRVEPEIYECSILPFLTKKKSFTQDKSYIPYIKVKYLENIVESFSLDRKKEMTIGSKDCDITLKDDNVSPHSCSINKRGGSFFITSKDNNEISVNNSLVFEEEIQEGDKIDLGNYQLLFIRQFDLPKLKQENIFQLDKNFTESMISNLKDFEIQFAFEQKSLEQMAKIIDHLLSFTNISEVKLNIISSAWMEAIQLLNTQNQDFRLRIIMTSSKLLLCCSGFEESGYYNLLNNFIKQKNRLRNELEEKETLLQEDVEFSIEESLLSSQESNKKFSDYDSVSDIDIDDFDPLKLAATLIIHAFDRIEFNKDSQFISLGVYL